MTTAATVYREVEQHAQRAWKLSMIETAPPGYTQITWLFHLLGAYHQSELQERYEYRKAEWQQLGRDLPKVPKVLPDPVLGRVAQMQQAVLSQAVRQVCEAALQPLSGRSVDAAMLLEAEHRVDKALLQFRDGMSLGPLSVSVRRIAEGSLGGTFAVGVHFRRGGQPMQFTWLPGS